MQQVFVRFDDADQVRNFVNAVSTMGVFALDLAQPQRLTCDSDDSAMLDKISPYLFGVKGEPGKQ